MAEQLTIRSGALTATVISVKMEIDDDDRDVIETEITVSNEAGIPMGQLEPVVETTEGSMFHPLDPISSIGPGLTRNFVFNFSLPGGEWTFKLWHDTAAGRKSLDLGPYHSEFELTKEKIGRTPKTTMGEGLFGGAFNMGMGDFGNVSERGFIDSSKIELVEYEAEHDIGGGTKINVSNAEAGGLSGISTEVEAPISNSLTDSLSTESAMMDSALKTMTDSTPEPLTGTTPTGPPSPPPSGAPTGPPSGAPSGPPTPPESPPEGAPTGPPSPPPSEAPTGPPSGAPSGPPTPPESPPEGAPTGPPSPPPSEVPTGPPSGAPSGPPTPPESPPEGPPSGPPSGAPSGPPSEAPTGPPTGPPV